LRPGYRDVFGDWMDASISGLYVNYCVCESVVLTVCCVLSRLSSFGMAYDFIDSIGDDVDVVADSEVRLSDSSCPIGLAFTHFHFADRTHWCSSSFTLLTEHKEAPENPLQQVPRQHGGAPRGEDSAAGRAGHPGALHEVFSGTAAGLSWTLLASPCSLLDQL